MCVFCGGVKPKKLAPLFLLELVAAAPGKYYEPLILPTLHV